MTKSSPDLNSEQLQPLTPPPATTIMNDGTTIKTVGDEWKFLECSTPSLKFLRFRDICTPSFINGLQWAIHTRLSQIAPRSAYSVLCTLFSYLDSLHKQKKEKIDLITQADMLNHRSHQPVSFANLRSLMGCWAENSYYGLEPEVEKVFDLKHRIGRKSNGLKGVITLDPQDGPLLELEAMLFNQALSDLYAGGQISLGNFCLGKMTLTFGARPEQWSRLKIKNLVVRQEFDGGRSYVLLIPWAKQVSKKKPKAFDLTRSLGDALLAHAEQIRMRFPKDALPEGLTWDDLPLFPVTTNHNPTPKSADLLTHTIKEIGKKAHIISPRPESGDALIKIGARRLRHTVGTRLATKGEYSARQIANYLMQTNILSPQEYVDLKEHLLDNFNEYWQVRLEENAKITLGITTEEEAEEIIGPYITYSEDGRRRPKVGKCGKVGCKARAPLACYGCAAFRPLLRAPHAEYLQILLDLRDRQLEVAPKNIGVFDKAIFEVRRVNAACERIESDRGE